MVYMGIERPRNVQDLWNTSTSAVIHPSVQASLGLVRWEQIYRYLFLDPDTQDPPGNVRGKPKHVRPFKKVDYVGNIIRERFQHFWAPGSNLAIDEAIQAFRGRDK